MAQGPREPAKISKRLPKMLWVFQSLVIKCQRQRMQASPLWCNNTTTSSFTPKGPSSYASNRLRRPMHHGHIDQKSCHVVNKSAHSLVRGSRVPEGLEPSPICLRLGAEDRVSDYSLFLLLVKQIQN